MPDKLKYSEIVKTCKNCLHLEVCLKHLRDIAPDTSQEEINLVLMRGGCCKNFIDKDLINRLQTENERLLQKTQRPPDVDPMDFCGVLCNFAEGLIAKAKAEAYKECIEKLKEKEEHYDTADGYEGYMVDVKDIDNLYKELAGEKNG